MLKVTIENDGELESDEDFLVTLAKRNIYRSFINELISGRPFRKHEEWIEDKTPLQFVLDLLDQYGISEDDIKGY